MSTPRQETLLFSVKIDQIAAKKQAEDLTVAIRKERNELAGLEKQFEAGEVTEKEYGAEKVRLTKSIADNSRQLTINTNLSTTNSKSIAGQRAELSRLTDAYIKAVNPTKAEAKAIKDLSDSLKEQEAEIGNNTRNVGNYSESILHAANNIPFFSNALATCQQGLIIAKASFGSFSGFLKSGFVGAVALAAASVAAFFKATGEGEDVLERIQARVKGGFSGAVQNLANAGKAAADAYSANSGYKVAWETAKSFFGYLGSEEATNTIKNLSKAYLDNTIALQTMEDAERAFKVTVSKRRLEIDKLLLTTKDLSLSDEEQIENLEKVKALETDLNATEVSFARVRVANAQRLVDAVKDPTDDLRDSLADAQVELNRLIGESALVQQTADNRISLQRQQQEQKRAAAAKVISDAIKAEQDYDFKTAVDNTTAKYKALDTLDLKARLDSLAALNKDEISRTKIKRDALEEQYANLKKFGKDTADIENQIAQTNVDIARATIAEEIKLQNAKLQAFSSIGNAIGALSSLLAKNGANSTEFSRALAVTQIYINEAIAISENVALATKAAAAGGPAAPFLIAGYIATGLAEIFAGIEQANAVMSQANTPKPNFAGGGNFLTTGPQMILVGDNPGGVEHVSVTPVSGKGKSSIGRGANLLQLGGGGQVAAFGAGQFAGQTIINQVNNQVEAGKQIVNGIEGRIPVLVVESYERVKGNMQRVITQSTV